MALSVLGYDGDELIGRSPLFITVASEHEWIQAAVQRAVQGEHVRGDIEIITKDGHRFFSSISLKPIIEEGAVSSIVGILFDITKKKAVESMLMKSEERMRRLSDMAMEGIVVVENGMISDANEAFCRMFGYEISEVIGTDLNRLIRQDQGAVPGVRTEVKGVRKGGEQFDIEFVMRSLVQDSEEVQGAAVQDISHRKRIEYIEDHDELTGFLNNKGFIKRLREEMAQVSGTGERIAVITIRIERDELSLIKNIRLEMERIMLNVIPLEIAERLRNALFETDAMARVDRLEYLTLHRLPARSDEKSPAAVLHKILDVFSVEFMEGIRMIPRLGVTFFPDDYPVQNPVQVIQNSSYACGEALRKKTDYVFYDERSHLEMRQRLEFDRDLVLAVREEACGNFLLYYQPKVNREGLITGMEALIRWNHPRWNGPDGLVSAMEFMHRAEEIGLVGEIGNWVLREACHRTKRWHDISEKYRHLQIAVNISPSQLVDGFEDFVESVLAETGLPPEKLELEITERESVKKNNLTVLYRLKERAVSIAIDDFGVDYSSLNKLPKLSVDTIKLDRSYIENIATDSDYENLVYYTIKMVHGFNYKVVAEGVEEEDQARKLFFEMDCDKIQGFYFYRPLSEEAFERAIEENL
jgi:diguanylate cyclase